ncbi:MAG: hypothetical protein QNJ42_04145 [Crocosphaera sp.]|nr:hypothetical protein [Crocosphaera sp.]
MKSDNIEKNLLDLYKISVEEYRFQVLYNWDRNRFYITLTAGVFTIGAGILRIPNLAKYEYLLIPLFIIGSLISFVGLQTLRKGQEYYRATILKMSSLENQLGLTSEETPIATTQGQKESKINLKDPNIYIKKRLRLGTITYWIACLFVLGICVNILAILFISFDLLYLQS